MSLLMDALKRAERIKQGEDAGSASPPTATAPTRDLAAELGIAAAAPPQVAPANPVMTELTLAPLGSHAPAPQTLSQPAAASSPRERPTTAPRGTVGASQAADRLAAKSVFAAKSLREAHRARMTVSVDGRERARWSGDFSTINQPISIHAHSSTVQIEQVRVRKLQ